MLELLLPTEKIKQVVTMTTKINTMLMSNADLKQVLKNTHKFVLQLDQISRYNVGFRYLPLYLENLETIDRASFNNSRNLGRESTETYSKPSASRPPHKLLGPKVFLTA